MASREQKTVSAVVPADTGEALDELAEQRGVSRSAMIRDLLEDAVEEDDPAANYGAVVPSAIAAVTVAAIALVAVGELVAGVATFALGAFIAINWALARVFGWSSVAIDVVNKLREGLAGVGGVRGFFQLMWARWKDEHPIDDPQTPVEKAARLDLYLFHLGALIVLVAAAGWALLEVGAFQVLGGEAALAYVLLLLVVTYAFPAAILVSVLSMLAIETARSWREDDAIAPEGEDA